MIDICGCHQMWQMDDLVWNNLLVEILNLSYVLNNHYQDTKYAYVPMS